MKKICGITTKPGTITSFMLGNLEYVKEHGYESYCISSPGNIMSDKVIFIPIKQMKWGIMSPIELVKCVYILYKIFKREKFDIIQYATSNAALCSAIAGRLAKVPVRINCQWGISYPIYKGWKRLMFYYSHKTTCLLSTSVQPDSKSNLEFSIANKLYPPKKGEVIFNGSACGIDLDKYNFHKRKEWREELFDLYDLSKYKIIYGFVGRVVVEKGINELLEAFIKLGAKDSCLMIVGPLDDVGRLNQDLYLTAKSCENIIFVGRVANAAKYYAAFDFMMLPSYQEGFGMSVLEAAAEGTPSIISNIKGPTDLIRDGLNGFICEVRSSESLLKSMRIAYKMSKEDYDKMATISHEIVVKDFDSRMFKQAFLKNRDCLLEKSQKKDLS